MFRELFFEIQYAKNCNTRVERFPIFFSDQNGGPRKSCPLIPPFDVQNFFPIGQYPLFVLKASIFAILPKNCKIRAFVNSTQVTVIMRSEISFVMKSHH